MLIESELCSFLFKCRKIQNKLPIFIIVIIDWFLWVIIPQIGNRAIICLFLLILYFKFIEECASGLLSYIAVKVFKIPNRYYIKPGLYKILLKRR